MATENLIRPDPILRPRVGGQAELMRFLALRRIPLALSWGLPAAFAFFAVVASLMEGYMGATFQARQVEAEARRALRRETAWIQGRIEYLLATADLAPVQQLLADLGTDPGLEVAFLADDQGMVLASSPRRFIGQAADVAVTPARFSFASMFNDIRQQRQPQITTAPGGCCIATAYPVVLAIEPGAPRPSRIGVLYVSREIKGDVQSVHRRTWLRTGIVTALLSTGAVAFALLGRGLITGRARRIIHAAERYAAGEREARAGLGGQDELGRIGQAFDAMADSLSRAHERIEASEERFRQLAENIREAFWLTGPDKNTMLYVSPGYEKIWGRPRRSLYAEPRAWLDAVHPEDRERVLHAALTEQAAGTYDLEYRILRPDGAERWIRDRAFPIRDSGGTVYRIAGVAEDITERKKTEARLRESEERFAAFMNNSPATAFVKDAEGRLLYINPTFERAFDFKERDWRGKTDLELWDEATARQLRTNDLAILSSGEPLPVEETVRQADGEHQWIIFKFPFRDQKGELYLGGMGIDITERKKAEQRARYLAFHDPLTGLPNRSLVLDRLTGMLAQAERERREAAILFMDLDRFKDINDTLGHSTGDRLLQQVGARLRAALREGDTVARLGGDEFLILLPRIEAAEDAGGVAQKLIEIIGTPYALETRELHVGASMGVSLYPRDGADPETLIRHADAALYHAKNSGRHQYQFFDRALDTRAHERLAFTHQLRQALARGEIEVHYQPQIDAASGAVVGLEALARWNHPERGPVSPAVFVPIAEDSGLIVDLGRIALREASAAAVACRRAGFGSLRMAVNLSARQLHHPRLVEDVAASLAECDLAPADLELELTESSVMEDLAVAAERIGELVGLGVRLALDDFGTGYSSLAYLKRFRIHALKIDRSFVCDLPRDREDAAIVRAITAMGRALGLDLLAEGVETEAQARFLFTQGCRYMQGYLFCRPLPLEELLPWLRAYGSGVRAREKIPMSSS